MVTSFVVAVSFFVANKMGMTVASHVSLIIGVAITSVVWIAVSFLGPQNERATLESFYRLVRPAGPGWAEVRRRTGLPASNDSLPMSFAAWILGCLFVYAALFGTGSFLYGRTSQALLWLGVFVVATLGLSAVLPRIWRSSDATR